MIFYKTEKIYFNNRKEAKDYLGGTNRYNKELRYGNLININTIAHNGTNKNTEKISYTF